MSDALRPARESGRWVRWLDRAGTTLLVLVSGVVLGQQFVTPNKRVIPVLVAILLFGLSWRVDMATGIGVMVVALPFPRPTVFGNTNLAFVLLLLVIWLLRVAMGQTTAPRRTPIDVPLIALFVCYVVSFYNIDPAQLGQNLMKFGLMVGSWLMFYMIASNLRTQRDFERVLTFQAISVLTVCLIALYEVTHPGVNMVRLLYSPLQKAVVSGDALGSWRVGSVFFDYELLSEYCALNLFMVLFLFLRARSVLSRVAFGGLLLMLAFVLFTTSTRGGLVALAVGLLYLLWLVRRRLTFVALAISAGAVAAVAIAVNGYVAAFTHAGNLFERLSESQVKGLVPDTRSVVWPEAWRQIFDHPLIGHGPYYAALTSARIHHWPHSLYLIVANNVGFIGLAVLLWLLLTLLYMSRPVTDDLPRGDYVQSYLLVAHVQVLVFLVDEIKIEYLRNEIYQFQVWMMFALVAAASLIVRQRAAAGRARAPA